MNISLFKTILLGVSIVLLFSATAVVGYSFYQLHFKTLVGESLSIKQGFLEVVYNSAEEDDEKIILTGDIMLARDVERRQSLLSPGHSLSELEDLFKSSIVVGNFEASIPVLHEPTPIMVMKFSVTPQNLDILVQGGLTHLSLANNHSLDHGLLGYENTLTELHERGFVAGGYPVGLSSSSVSYVEANDKKFALVFINATFSYPDTAIWHPFIKQAESSSDAVIVYIHWGDEYELIHNNAQERLAHELIDAGVDLIVGHHPHVVQDIELYKGRLVFYSLGNLVFDQYWNNDVSEGLILELEKVDAMWRAELHPVESRTVKTQPQEMTAEESQAFFRRLAERSDEALYEQILDGSLSLQF